MQSDKSKLIFLDIDGTMLVRGRYVPDSTVEALRRAREKGHRLFIASGRSVFMVPEVIRRIGFDGIVASAGAYIMYGDTPIFHQPMKKEWMEDMVDYLEKHGAAIMAETNDGCYLSQYSYQVFHEHIKKEGFLSGKEAEGVRKEFLNSFTIHEDVASVADINKILYYEAQCSLEEMKEEWKDCFSIIPNSVVMGTKDNSGEISEKGTHKASGMERMLNYLGRDRRDTIAFGDGFNDVEMLEYAGVGVALGNAADGVKEYADFVTDSIEQDGLYKAFQKLELI